MKDKLIFGAIGVFIGGAMVLGYGTFTGTFDNVNERPGGQAGGRGGNIDNVSQEDRQALQERTGQQAGGARTESGRGTEIDTDNTAEILNQNTTSEGETEIIGN